MGMPFVGKAMRKVFGTRNERMVKRYLRVVDTVNEYSDATSKLTDAELRAKTGEFRKRFADGEKSTDMIPEVFAIAREAMDRSVGIRNIFNPDLNFDASKMSQSARSHYEKMQAEIESMEPAEPVGDLRGCSEPVQPWQLVDIPVELYDAVRGLYPQSKPPFRARPFDVQIIGGVVLSEGRIAEMKTGEGKTIVAPLATYLAALEGKQVHVITVNDYLVQRDRDWTFPFFRALGLSVGAIHPMHMQPLEKKQEAYSCDVVYGTTSEFGFDYLRDNMKLSTQEQVQKQRNFAIVDEVDSTLIDEARTPLIISGLAYDHAPRYDLADELARHLEFKQKDWNAADEKVQACLVEIAGLEGDIRNARDKDKAEQMKKQLEEAKQRLPGLEEERDKHTQYYEVELDKKRAQVTHEGIEEAQRKAGVGSFYVGDNTDLPHLLENAVRSHAVYQRDRDYVVQPDDKGELGVVIVDQHTGRKMIGRQWSDGLHQAIEAKERVPIKPETQTMATITIQNFFKLYDRLAGMTGTADTEATEFHEIYKLDVICIPTNEPVIRADHNDIVFMSVKDKWQAIVDEIKAFHDVGRPVLVGTTSVEKSEVLSDMLSRKHNIKHEVLNAKQHEREADIVAHAGELGAVMIATNMAGRGTDIVLRKFAKDELIEHWKRRGICPKDVTSEMPEDQITARIYKHIAPKELNLRKNEVESMADEDIRVGLLRKWAAEFCWWLSEGKTENASADDLLEQLDKSGACLLHRLRMFENIEDLGGLHVIGTERHESRRIDNQLRGRSGRQGDKGSSRFFLSLEDDLMKMFAGPRTLTLLSKLGMKEGDAIEHPMLSRAVEKAQRKVEERNFLMRKNLLEYDEPLDMQRGHFYSMRQDVLEGTGVKDIIFEQIDNSVEDAVNTYLKKNYVADRIAEEVEELLNVSIDPDRIRGKDQEDLYKLVKVDAKEEAAAMIRVTVNEYMSNEVDQIEWDLSSLADWANKTFHGHVKVSDLQDLSPTEARHVIEPVAEAWIEAADLTVLDKYLTPHYAETQLANWVREKINVDVDPKSFEDMEEPDVVVHDLMDRAREAYQQREITYPIEFALQMTTAMMQQDPKQAIEQFCQWVKSRYELEWQPDALPSSDPRELRKTLVDEAEKWDEERIRERAGRAVQAGRMPDELDSWMNEHLSARMTPEERERAMEDPQAVAEEKIAALLRLELTQFERWVMLQIFDQSWKDHLHSMDQVKESIGLRSFSQRDPRIEFKKESARLFEEMQQTIREKVTDMIYKGRLMPQVARQGGQQETPAGPNGQQGGAQPQEPQRARPQAAQPATAAAAAAVAATPEQKRDIASAVRAGAAAAKTVAQPARAMPTVGRNEPCPCGSGKKFKHCCGKRT